MKLKNLLNTKEILIYEDKILLVFCDCKLIFKKDHNKVDFQWQPIYPSTIRSRYFKLNCTFEVLKNEIRKLYFI